ncbi:MAG: ATP-binding protein [Gemmatimonadota bacterium]
MIERLTPDPGGHDALRRTTRALRAISQTNRAIIRATAEEPLRLEVCRVAVEEGGYRMAWVGYAEEDKTIRPVAWWGIEDGYLAAVDIRWDDSERGRGPMGTAIRTGEPQVSRDIALDRTFELWRDEAARRGYRSMAVLPLRGESARRGPRLGALAVYSERPDAFDDAEISLLQEMASDLAFGIRHLRRERDHRALEERLRQAQKMEAVGHLAGGLAHDFNNVLSVIQTNAELLEDALGEASPGSPSGATPAAQDGSAQDGNGASGLDLLSCVEDIRAGTRRGSEITRNLLAFSRRQHLRLRSMNVGRVVRGLERALRSLVPESVEIRMEVEDRLPPVRSDPNVLEQILMNLVTNARDAMAGRGELRIDVSEETLNHPTRLSHGRLEPGGYVVLAVSDTGHGIEPDHLDRLFEPMFTTKGPDRGTGLGLSMVWGLVTQQGGTVDVESEPGTGATFRVHLPATDEPAEDAAEAGEKTPEAVRGRGETVLLVEDDDALRRVGARILERLGYEVVTASDGREALRTAVRNPETPDVVVSDLVMPGMGGTDLRDALRDRGIDIPFVFTSGYTERDVRELTEADAHVPFLEKPWTVEAMARRVRKALEDGTGG